MISYHQWNGFADELQQIKLAGIGEGLKGSLGAIGSKLKRVVGVKPPPVSPMGPSAASRITAQPKPSPRTIPQPTTTPTAPVSPDPSIEMLRKMFPLAR